MSRSVGGVSVPVVLNDGDRETIIKNILIHPMMEFDFFTTILHQMIGIINQPLGIIVYCVDTNDARFPPATRPKILVTRSNFPTIAKGEGSFFFMMVLMRSPTDDQSFNYQENLQDLCNQSQNQQPKQINPIDDSYNYQELPQGFFMQSRTEHSKLMNAMEAYDYLKYHSQDFYKQSIIEQAKQNSSVEVYSYQQKPQDFYSDKRPPIYPKKKQQMLFQQQFPPPGKDAVRIRDNSQYDDLMRKRAEEENFKLSVENAHENWMKISNAGGAAANSEDEDVVFCVECRNAMLNGRPAEFHLCTNDPVVVRTDQNMARAVQKPNKDSGDRAV